MTFYAQATFNGKSDDLVRGHSYTVRVSQLFFNRIGVQPVHGYEYNTVRGIRPVISPDLHCFLHDWTITKHLDGPQ